MGNVTSTPGRPEPPPPPPPLPASQPPPSAAEPLELPPPGQNFTCEICIEPIEIATQTFRTQNPRCRTHYFCNDCMIKYIKAKLEDSVPRIPCPALNCSEFLDPEEYWVLVGDPLFVRWCDGLCESAIMGMDRCYCPNVNCSSLIVNECGGTVKKATCPNCKRSFCFRCKIPWHSGFRCEETGELRDQNDRAFGVLAEQRKWKRCPRCHHFVELIAGCRIVKCRCHASFCYSCGRLVQHGCDCGGRCQRIFNCLLYIVLGFNLLLFFLYFMCQY
ncbi:OLC1v1002292C1 [Oldenlandia corymbosa var. corymbosa]|uniref:RBR-type E3 ubiquitin transferase n=1 Tax=Oldenlandia corymbosa var. corymbosa TaxID=529605 RepID=A0AAV1D7B2_OLDCO|nr:OLC1v1002292C1 [Oldenlandia corymbosa var. corymbosa]